MEEPFLRRPREQHQRLRRRRLRDGHSRFVVNDVVPADIGLVILDSRGFQRIKYFWVAHFCCLLIVKISRTRFLLSLAISVLASDRHLITRGNGAFIDTCTWRVSFWPR